MNVRICRIGDDTYLIPVSKVDEILSSTENQLEMYKVKIDFDGIDVVIANDTFKKLCPKCETGKHKITVNGKVFERSEAYVGYSEISALAGKDMKYYPSIVYRNADEEPSTGVLRWSDGIKTKEGTVFSVMYTGRA